MAEIKSTKVPEIRWCCRLLYSAVDQLRLIGGLKGVNTMYQFEKNNFWCLGICLSGPNSRVAPTVNERREPMPKPAKIRI